MFQSTHPRRVWRKSTLRAVSIGNVSIHTPTKGVTYGWCWSKRRVFVSIHTPTKGVTGSRHQVCFFTSVSIHTPTKGVTAVYDILNGKVLFQSTHPRRVWHDYKGYRWKYASFNPHTHEGCDFGKHNTNKTNDMFQSTHPRRVWQTYGYAPRYVELFQSTHPRRVWLDASVSLQKSQEFQSTHPRRVWRLVVNRGLMRIVFQSTHPRRVWLVDTMAL